MVIDLECVVLLLNFYMVIQSSRRLHGVVMDWSWNGRAMVMELARNGHGVVMEWVTWPWSGHGVSRSGHGVAME
eukprot:478301-Lingulodinium_polyedra.AAC.1